MTKERKLPSGFLEVIPETEMATMDDAQKAQVQEFIKAHLSAGTIPECYEYLMSTPRSEEDKEIIAYKYLMARKWKMEDAVKMFTDTVTWRESHKYHKQGYFPCAFVLRGYDQQMLQQMFAAPLRSTTDRVDKIVARVSPGYKFAIHKWDKQGHPVIIDLTGRLKPKRTVAALRALAPPGEKLSEPFVLLRAYQNELCQYLVRAQDTAFVAKQEAEGTSPVRRVTSVTGIMDMTGLGMDHASGELIDAIKQMLSSTQAYYPEMSYRTFVVNCSSVVMFIFNIIKGWMDPRSRNKLVFCSPEDTPGVLRAVIDAEHLPKFLGGECECEGGCMCPPEELEKMKDTPDPTPELGADGDLTSDITVASGKHNTYKFELAAGATCRWNWVSSESQSIEFGVTFTPAAAGATAETVVAKTKTSEGKGEHTAAAAGTITLDFDNSASWVKSKYLRARVAISPKQ